MNQLQLQAKWEEILHKVEEQESLSDAACQRWLFPLTPVSLTDDTLTIAAQNDFSRDWIKGRYVPILEDAVSAVSGRKLHIIITSLGNDDAESTEEKAEPIHIEKPQSPEKNEPKREKDLPEQGSLAAKTVNNSNSMEPIRPGDASTLNPRYTFDTFVTGASNRLAHAAAIAIADEPGKQYNPLFLYGGVGLGKTHLMHAIGNKVLANFPDMRVLYISSEKFTNELINSIRDNTPEAFRQKYRNIDVLLVDDIQFLSKKERTQEEFFHTFNTLKDANKHIILSSDRAPNEIKDLQDRLISRFEGGLVADVQPPDLETRIAILRKKAQIEHLTVPNEVMVTIATRIDKNIRELEGALTRVVAYASLTKRPIDNDLVLETLEKVYPSERKREINIEFIQEVVAKYFKIAQEDLLAKKRTRSIAFPRQVAMYLCRELTDESLPQIGSDFGGRDHTTVMHACDKISTDRQNDTKVDSMLKELIASIEKG